MFFLLFKLLIKICGSGWNCWVSSNLFLTATDAFSGRRIWFCLGGLNMTFTDLILLVLPHHTSQRFKQWLQTYKQSKIPTKKSFYIFLYFGKWNFLALILKNSLYFLKFKETEAPQKFFIIQETKLAYISGNRTFLHPKKLNNYAFNETPSGETECLSNFYYLLAAEAFRIHCSKLLSLKCIFKNCFF